MLADDSQICAPVNLAPTEKKVHEDRVLFLISSGGFYGAENVVIELARNLITKSGKVFIGVFNYSKNPHTEIADKARYYGIMAESFECRVQLDLKTISSIRAFIKKHKINIVHSHGYKSNFYTLMATLFTNAKTVTTCHLWTKGSFRNRVYELLDRLLLRIFDKIVTVSDEIRTEIIRMKVSESKVALIPNGIDLYKFRKIASINRIRKALNIKNGHKVIGTIGRLAEQKGHSFLIKSAFMMIREFPDTDFLIVGDGPLRNELMRSIRNTDLLPHFIFLGIRDDIPDLLKSMDIFVLPSISEGLPMVILEAMSAGTPIVATHVGDIPKVIDHERTGLLVPPKNPKALYSAMKELLLNKNISVNLAQNAQQFVSLYYSSRVMAEKYFDIYQSLLAIQD